MTFSVFPFILLANAVVFSITLLYLYLFWFSEIKSMSLKSLCGMGLILCMLSAGFEQ